jgi:hypothetical protein
MSQTFTRHTVEDSHLQLRLTARDGLEHSLASFCLGS